MSWVMSDIVVTNLTSRALSMHCMSHRRRHRTARLTTNDTCLAQPQPSIVHCRCMQHFLINTAVLQCKCSIYYTMCTSISLPLIFMWYRYQAVNSIHYTTRIHWHLTPAYTQHDLLWPWPWPLPFLGSKNSKANVLFSDCLYCLVCFQDGLATLVQRKCGFSEYRDGPVHDDRRDAWTSCCSVLHDEAVLWQGHNGHRDGTGAEILCSCLSWSWTMSHAAM